MTTLRLVTDARFPTSTKVCMWLEETGVDVMIDEGVVSNM